MTTAKVLIWVIRIVEWSFLGSLGLFLYRKFKFPSLPWILAYFIASWVPKMLMPFIAAIFLESSVFKDDLVNASTEAMKSSPQQVQAVIEISTWMALLGKVSYFLLTLLVVSEIIYIIESKTKMEIPRPLELTLSIRKNVTLVGMSVVLLTLFAHFFTATALYKIIL